MSLNFVKISFYLKCSNFTFRGATVAVVHPAQHHCGDQGEDDEGALTPNYIP